jgi:hypothetical protein
MTARQWACTLAPIAGEEMNRRDDCDSPAHAPLRLSVAAGSYGSGRSFGCDCANTDNIASAASHQTHGISSMLTGAFTVLPLLLHF